MKRSLMLTAIIAAALCGTTLAQTTAPSSADPSTPPEQPQAQPAQPSLPQQQNAPTASLAASQASSTRAVRIAPGSVIPVLLAKTVDAKKAKTGDEVVAKVAQDMKSTTGEVVVPKDTKILGHVTEAQARSKEQKESQVGITFDKAVLKDQEVSLPMSIQAVVGQEQSNDSSSNGESQGPAAPAPGTPSGSGARNSGATNASPQASPAASPSGEAENHPQQSGARPPINGNTQGVVGISNLKLEASQNAAQGSVLSSEKNNVKLEGGTFMLLRVGQ